MKCTSCGAEIPEGAKFCIECGQKIVRKKFCPACGTEVSGGKFCPECGASLATYKASAAEKTEEDKRIDELIKGFDDRVAKKTRDDNIKFIERRQKLENARVFALREMYTGAKQIYDELLKDYPGDMDVYMGYIRIATENYTKYEGSEIDKSIRDAQKISGKEDLSEFDHDYAGYVLLRKKYTIDKEVADYEQQKKEISASKSGTSFEIKDGVLVKYKGRSSNVVIPDCVTRIGHGAFYGKKSLKSVKIPYGVTQIDYEAFFNCPSLTSVTLPSSVKIIGDSAFGMCKDLADITIPDSVTRIGERAFMRCGLRRIIIPDSVTVIGYHAFSLCWGLKIYCQAPSQPKGWAEGWGYDDLGMDCDVVWGYKE